VDPSEVISPEEQRNLELDRYYVDERSQLVGMSFGYGALTEENAESHTLWHAASGHPGGWRVCRGLLKMQQLEGPSGRLILLKTHEAAQRRADALNAATKTRLETHYENTKKIA
jgi:hypothetical protein